MHSGLANAFCLLSLGGESRDLAGPEGVQAEVREAFCKMLKWGRGACSACSPHWPRVRADHCPGGRERPPSLRGTAHSGAGLVHQAAAPAEPGTLPRVPGPAGDPPHSAASRGPPPAVSLFSDVTPRPRPSTPTFPPPHLPLQAPKTLQPPEPGPSGAPPAARPGLRPLALSPTCLCYSSSLARLASDTAAGCKTRRAESPPHLEPAPGAGLEPPRPGWGGERVRARECLCLCPTRAARAAMMIWDGGPMSGGLEGGVWEREGGGGVFVCVRERADLVHRVMFCFGSVCAGAHRRVCGIACGCECACCGRVHAYLRG